MPKHTIEGILEQCRHHYLASVTKPKVIKELASLPDGHGIDPGALLQDLNGRGDLVYLNGSYRDAENVVIPPLLRGFVYLRWQDWKEVLDFFRSMCEWALDQPARRADYYYSRVVTLYTLSAALVPKGVLIETLDSVTREEVVECIRSFLPF